MQTDSQKNLHGTLPSNLARKWRSRNFDQVIGQDIPVRMLKNSLFLQHYFPVYLFCGQRGCGKTTMARIFAAAFGCQQLEQFQREPHTTKLPCLECISCVAMQEGRHPDFIEIDAASHTGVDNVRTIIDSATLLPSLGRKRIYLIDEAHMLSKAAFNALLKILEEPPRTALFILATTDPQKIIETVRSRCFRVNFRPIESQCLIDHLRHICEKEQIAYDPQGLALIVRESEGSARDALNMVEQVRLAHTSVTEASVLSTLGYLDDAHIAALAEAVLSGNGVQACSLLEEIQSSSHDLFFVWRRFAAFIRALLWYAYDVEPSSQEGDWAAYRQLAKKIPLERLHAVAKLLLERELIFLKTSDQGNFFKMLLLSLCMPQRIQKSNNSNSSPVPAQQSAPQVSTTINTDAADDSDDDDDEQEEDDEDDDQEEEIGMQIAATTQAATVTFENLWVTFIKKVEQLNDPLLSSLFSQTISVSFNASQKVVSAQFSNEFSLFADVIERGRKAWGSLLEQLYGTGTSLLVSFSEVKRAPVTTTPQRESAKNNTAHYSAQSSPQNKNREITPLTPVAHGPLTTMVLKYFPGEVREL